MAAIKIFHVIDMPKKVLILGAAGRDFHNFNVFFRDNTEYSVVGFTAAQIPEISGRTYPAKLAGKLYPEGIQIYDEKDMGELIERHHIEEAYFSYSDVSHEHVMHLCSRAQSKGASFVLLGPNETMLQSSKVVIAVTAVRTGCGKSPLTKKLTNILKSEGVKFVVIRHPMPYGDLEKQAVQRFETLDDLDKHKCTIEEREEYAPHINNGVIVYAGVDYERILREAEKEANVIIWDGGNNDFSFYRPNLLFVVTDALRPGHELLYYPGETNMRMADVIVINKVSENPEGAKIIRSNIKKMNERAMVLETDMELTADSDIKLNGKKVIVVEDGPTVTHGGMGFGAGYRFALNQKANPVDPRISAAGSIKETLEKYPHLKHVLPAMGYYGKQLKDLEVSINKSGAEVVVSGTPIDLRKVLKLDIPIVHVSYDTKVISGDLKKTVDSCLNNE